MHLFHIIILAQYKINIYELKKLEDVRDNSRFFFTGVRIQRLEMKKSPFLLFRTHKLGAYSPLVSVRTGL